MDAYKLLSKRNHIHRYKEDKIPPKELIDDLLYKAWKTTPSKNNFMPYNVNVLGPDKQEEKKKIHPLVSNWKNEKAQSYASVLIEKYNEPKVKGEKMLLWEDVTLIDEEKYEYKVKKIDKLYVLDEHIEHSFPADHIDYVYSTLKIPKIQAKDGKSTIDPDLVGKFAGVTGSIIVDGLKGEVTARCGDTVANDVTLNFVLDSINGKVEPTKEEYAKRILDTR